MLNSCYEEETFLSEHDGDSPTYEKEALMTLLAVLTILLHHQHVIFPNQSQIQNHFLIHLNHNCHLAVIQIVIQGILFIKYLLVKKFQHVQLEIAGQENQLMKWNSLKMLDFS